MSTTARRPDLDTATDYADRATEAMEQVWACVYGSELEREAESLHRQVRSFAHDLHTERIEVSQDGELIGERHE